MHRERLPRAQLELTCRLLHDEHMKNPSTKSSERPYAAGTPLSHWMQKKLPRKVKKLPKANQPTKAVAKLQIKQLVSGPTSGHEP